MAKTKEQELILGMFKDSCFSQVVDALQKAKRAKDAILKLPHKNEQGESVVHGDNMDMDTISGDYVRHACVYWNDLTRENQDKINAMFPNWKNHFRE